MNLLGVGPIPRLTPWPTRGLVIVESDFTAALDDGRYLHVPHGLVCDGASVPNVLWGVLDATPLQLLVPGICHDAAYRVDASWYDGKGNAMPTPIARHEADDMLRLLVLWAGASSLDADKVRWGVGVGGASAWHQKTLAWQPT